MDSRRNQLIVNWKVQGRILGLIIGAVFLSALVMGGLLYYCLSVLYEISALHPEIAAMVFERSVIKLIALTGLGLLVVIIYASLLAIRFSNRVVGPIYRITQELEEMRNNDRLDLIYTRKQDFHKGLVRALNNFIINFRDEVEAESEE